jgi:sRNA-binding protein
VCNYLKDRAQSTQLQDYVRLLGVSSPAVHFLLGSVCDCVNVVVDAQHAEHATAFFTNAQSLLAADQKEQAEQAFVQAASEVSTCALPMRCTVPIS